MGPGRRKLVQLERGVVGDDGAVWPNPHPGGSDVLLGPGREVPQPVESPAYALEVARARVVHQAARR